MKKLFMLVLILTLTSLIGCSEQEEVHLEPETATATMNSPEVELTQEVNLEWWVNKVYVSPTTGSQFFGFQYSDDGEPYFTFGTVCSPINSANLEVIQDDTLGTVLGYTLATQSLSNGQLVEDEFYILYYVSRDLVSVSNRSASYSDEFQATHTNNETSYFYNEQSFLAVSTSDEVILTFFEFEDSAEIYYKGELSTGQTFWFEYSKHIQDDIIEFTITGEYSGVVVYDVNSSVVSIESTLLEATGDYVQLPHKSQNK